MAKKLADSIVMEESTPSVCSREFTFTIPADAVRAENDRVVSYIAGMVQLPGFRPGKAPVSLVAGKYAKEIEEELRNRFFQTAIALAFLLHILYPFIKIQMFNSTRIKIRCTADDAMNLISFFQKELRQI